MPGKSERDIVNDIMDTFGKDIYDQVKPDDIWVSPDEKIKINEEEAIKKAKDSFEDVLKEFEKQQKMKPKTDVERLRDELMREIKDIKRAINILGIMLESEEPSEEDLKKHATLREAYRKYKMIEALTLGQNEE